MIQKKTNKSVWRYLSSMSIYRCPFHADLGNVLDFNPSYNPTQEIAEIVNCFQNNNQIQIHFELLLFWHHKCFCYISGRLAARNKIKYTSKISMNRDVSKSTYFWLWVVLELWYCSNPFLKSLFHKMTLLSKKYILTSSKFWKYLKQFSSKEKNQGYFKKLHVPSIWKKSIFFTLGCFEAG